jgi:hypothetical protein
VRIQALQAQSALGDLLHITAASSLRAAVLKSRRFFTTVGQPDGDRRNTVDFQSSIQKVNGYRAIEKFLARAERAGYHDLEDLEPITVAAYVETLQRRATPPTVEQHRTAIRMPFSRRESECHALHKEADRFANNQNPVAPK